MAMKTSQFLGYIRSYNSVFAMTSVSCNETGGGYMSTFKIQGQHYHQNGSLLPMKNETETFLQIYFVGGDEEDIKRTNPSKHAEKTLLEEIQALMHQRSTVSTITNGNRKTVALIFFHYLYRIPYYFHEDLIV